MEDLWRIREVNYRIDRMADRAQYNRLVKRYHEEEEQANRDRLLYGHDTLDSDQTKNNLS